MEIIKMQPTVVSVHDISDKLYVDKFIQEIKHEFKQWRIIEEFKQEFNQWLDSQEFQEEHDKLVNLCS